MLIEVAAKEYLVDIEVRRFTQKTIRSYRNNLNLFVRFCKEVAEVEEMDDLTLAVVRRFSLYMTEKGRKGSYINGLLKVAKAFIQYCYEEGYGGFNTKKNFKWCKQEKAVIMAFTPADVRLILKSCKGGSFIQLRDAAVLTMLFETGIAKGTAEYVSVTGADIWVTSGGINSDLVGTVTVEKGGVTATAIDADGVIAESSSASGINAAVENEGSGTARGVVKITGDVAADADSEANGVFAIASEGELEISVDGTIRASANKAVGINTNNDEWAELQGAAGVKAKLNISADGVQIQGGNTDNDSASGVFLVAAHGGTGTVAIGEGGITASGAQASGAEVNAYGNSVATLTVAGDVSVTSTNGAANGVMVWAADGSAVNVTLDGELAISAADSDYISIGLNAEADNASVNMVAEGIKATGNAAVGAVLSADGKADVKLAVSGDVSGEAVGLGLGCSTGKQLGNVDAPAGAPA